MTAYQTFAQYYDQLTSNISYQERAVYYLKLLEQYGARPRGILLDLACGTGSLDPYFEQAGYDVVAVDVSEQMLNEAYEKKMRLGLNTLYLRQDMRQLDLYGTIDAAVCSLDSINHLTGDGDVLQAFRRVSLFSNPGAVFVFDVNTPYKHRKVLANETFVYDLEDVYVVWQNELDAKQDMVEIHLDIFERRGGHYLRSEEAFAERAYTTLQITRWLEQAGFELCAVYGLDTFSPPQTDTEKEVYVARKRG